MRDTITNPLRPSTVAWIQERMRAQGGPPDNPKTAYEMAAKEALQRISKEGSTWGAEVALETCRRCGVGNLQYQFVCDRAADEPYSMFRTCGACGMRWKTRG